MKPPPLVSINGIDVTQYVESIDFGALEPPTIHAGRPTGPIMLRGTFDDRETCSICRELFTPGPEGTCVLTDEATGQMLGIACPACGTAMVAPEE